MKKISTILLSSAILFSSPAHGATYNFISSDILPYLRIDSGWAKFNKVKGASVNGDTRKLTSSTKPIVGAGLGLGVNFGDKFRSDLTWTRHMNSSLHNNNANYQAKREPLIDAYSLNVYYELGNLVSIFNPYLGAGLGVAVVKDKMTVTSTDKNIASTSNTISRKNNFAYRFVIGSAFDLNDSIKFNLDYSFNDYGKSNSALDASSNQIGKTRYRAHIISAGLRFGM